MLASPTQKKKPAHKLVEIFSSWQQTMSTTRRFKCADLFKFNNINLDVLTETYNMPFYLQYLAKWPEYFVVEEAPNGKLMGYSKCAALPRAEKWMHLMLALLLQSWARQRGTTRTGTGM